ncbi:hypothetical protein AB6A40_009366 [Gnathostoma spinigerum]|uniref:Uncharacterized protein n=1 Tax=Gnathostoma spinigerum TaxID=75299 RepID=A0ABD6F0P3_9BILA
MESSKDNIDLKENEEGEESDKESVGIDSSSGENDLDIAYPELVKDDVTQAAEEESYDFSIMDTARDTEVESRKRKAGRAKVLSTKRKVKKRK